MRIAFDGCLLRPQGNTGVEKCILRLAQALSLREDLEIFLYVRRDVKLPEWGDALTVRRVVPNKLGRPGRIAWQQLGLSRWAKRDGAELIHAPGYVAPLSCKVPYVLTVYDMMALLAPRFCRPLNRWHYRTVMPRSIRGAALVLVPTEWVKSLLVSTLEIKENRVLVIPPGIDGSFQLLPREETEPLRERLFLEDTTLLFVGNLEINKNPLLILRVLSSLKKKAHKKAKCIFVGRKGRAFKEMGKYVKENKLYGNVILPGYVSDEDIVQYFNVADVFVFPSLHEGFGMPPLEAMACGCPVVCSEGPPFDEVVGNAALKADPHLPEKWVDSVERLQQEEEGRKQLIQAGLDRMKQFTWDSAAQRTVEAYGRAIEVC